MQLRKYTQFHVDFSSKWTSACTVLMGLAFFLRIVYYFGLMSLRDVGIIELLTSAILGIALCGGAVVCLNIMRLNAPGLYGLMGAAQCLFVVILSFTTGSAGRVILSLIWYTMTAAVYLATAGGYLPGRLFAALMFGVSIFVRLFFFDLGHIGLIRWVQEFAVLSTLAGFGCLAMGLKQVPHHK